MIINRDDWLKALEGLRGPIHDDPAALSVAELAELWKMSTHSARRRAEQLVEAGSAQRTQKQVTRTSNGAIMVMAYRLIDHT